MVTKWLQIGYKLAAKHNLLKKAVVLIGLLIGLHLLSV